MTTQNITAAPPVTLEEYAALPKHPRYELVKGVLVKQMAASEEHEFTGSLVVIRVGNHVLLNRLGRVYLSNRAYVTGPNSPTTSRMPDVSFVSNARLDQPDLAGMLYDGAPDLAVEILSESNTPAEIAQKIAEYLNAGGQGRLGHRHRRPHADGAYRRRSTAGSNRRRHRGRRRLPARLRLRRGRPAAGRRRLDPANLDQRRAPAQGDAVGQGDGGLQVAEQQEPAHRHRHLLGVLGDAGRHEQLNVSVRGRLVGLQAPATANVGIDRYLDGLAASTLPADEVDYGLATLAADELGGFGGYLQVSRHSVVQSRGCPSQGALGSSSDGGCCRAGRRGIRRRCSSSTVR